MSKRILKNSTAEQTLIQVMTEPETRQPAVPLAELYKLAKTHKIRYLFIQTILQHYPDVVRKEGLFKSFQIELMVYEQDLKNYRDHLQFINLILHQQNIPFYLLKGISLIYSNQPRDMGDLDILIHAGHLEKVITILEGHGFTYKGIERNPKIRPGEQRNWTRMKEWTNQFEFIHPDKGILIEIHTAIFEPKRTYPFDISRFNNAAAEMIKRSRPDSSSPVQQFCPEDKLWITVMHNAIRRSSVKKQFILRSVVDIRAIVLNESIDWECFFERADLAGTLGFILFSLEQTLQVFPALADKIPLFTGKQRCGQKDRLLWQVMNRSYNSISNSRPFGIYLYRVLIPFLQPSDFISKIKSLLIFPILLPEIWRIRQIYQLPVEKKAVWRYYLLEPLRWLKWIRTQKKMPLKQNEK